MESCRDADGPMQSTYGTTKQSSAWLFNDFCQTDQRKVSSIKELQSHIQGDDPFLGKFFTYQGLGM